MSRADELRVDSEGYAVVSLRWVDLFLLFSLMMLAASLMGRIFTDELHIRVDAICEAIPECVAEPRP